MRSSHFTRATRTGTRTEPHPTHYRMARKKRLGRVSRLRRKEKKDDTTEVVNLSSFRLTHTQISVLKKGLQFVPTPKKMISFEEFQKNIAELERRVALKLFFKNDINRRSKGFWIKSDWSPPYDDLTLRVTRRIREAGEEIWTKIQEAAEMPSGSNLNSKESAAIAELRKNPDIVIKPADKGAAVVVLNKTDYVEEGMRQLSNEKYYRKISGPMTEENAQLIREWVDLMELHDFIDGKTASHLKPEGELNGRTFYLLPKIHKEKTKWTKPNLPPGRPIVSNVGTEFSEVSRWLDFHLQPLVNELYKKSLVRDTYHFLETLQNLKLPPGKYLLFTADVSDLYTNIPLEGAKEKIQKWFEKTWNGSRPPTGTLLRLLDIILKKNDMEFNGEHFLQVKGVSMGNNCAPSIANLYLADMDDFILANVNPILYRRFIDDIFGIWDLSKGDFSAAIEQINSFDPNLKLVFETSLTKAIFLDTEIYITERLEKEGKLDHSVYFKPTDSHQLLHRNSCHPQHTFKGVVKSQILRFRRLCSEAERFENACGIIHKSLRTRGYSSKDLDSWKADILKKHPYNSNQKARVEKVKNPVLPFLLTYHPNLTFVPKMMREKWDAIRRQFPQAGEILPSNLVIAWRKNANLRNRLIRAKLPKNG